MSGVFQNIDPPPPYRPASVYPPPPSFGAGGGHTRWVERGAGGQYLEDARYSSVLYSSYVSTLWLEVFAVLIIKH
jgi:hypothetical protein